MHFGTEKSGVVSRPTCHASSPCTQQCMQH